MLKEENTETGLEEKRSKKDEEESVAPGLQKESLVILIGKENLYHSQIRF